MKSSIPRIVLVSTSPRRASLLKDVGIPFVVLAPTANEDAKPNEKAEKLVARLASDKAESVRPSASRDFQDCVLIAADTLVVAPGGRRILGKPRNRSEAVEMIEILSGKTHSVMTGYCLLRLKKGKTVSRTVKVVHSQVKMRKLSRGSIDRYVQTGEPMDKAGAYGAQGMGMALIESIEGSYTNVVGLPMSQLLKDLEKHCDLSLFDWVR